MPNNYQITIINKSDEPQSYLLFQNPPQVNPSPNPAVFANIYQSSPTIPNGGDTNFSITTQWYGINGTSPAQALGTNVKVSTAQGSQVTLGSGSNLGTTLALTTVNSDGESPEFNPVTPAAAAGSGAFQIVTDSSFTPLNLNNIFIGLGAPSANNPDIISPTATFPAEPSMTYTIWPKNTWYICTGSFQPGSIIEVQAVGAKQEVDFETGRADQTFIHNPNGTYSPA
ncbi:hypothetical protein FANTH_13128 [Fusarium anthophilum]|uniref:Uncharacterized protein n=1 Tax=Fusarium anthophilum TaxID=48485 RepID=A0A8H5DQT7_9HYPO|nr:hypothetical protein FANTH_13128 [Fusarium anthophilum]